MHQRRRKRLALLAGIAALLLVGRALLPRVVRHQVNRRLDAVEGYAGWVGHVDLALWRGAYALRGVEIFRDDGEVPVPLFAADRVDFSVDYRSLLRGELMGEVAMRAPIVHFVDDEDPEDRQTGAGRSWTRVLADLHPFHIDRLQVFGGEVHFHRFDVDPPVDVHFDDVNLVVLGLTNTEELAGGRRASLAATAMAMGHAGFQLQADFELASEGRRFDLDAQLYGLDLVAIESLLRAYAPVDVESGELDLMIELAGEGGQVLGYVQPMFRDLVVFDWEDDALREGDGPLRLAWEAIVGAAGRLLENQSEDQLATRVPIEGPLEAPDADVPELVASLLRNAFVEAFKPRLEGLIGAR